MLILFWYVCNYDFFWIRSVIQSLDLISKSENLGLLNLFPEMLDDWFRRSFLDTIEKRIQKISKTWFTNLLDELNRNTIDESKFIFLIFQRLENMYPLLNYRINLWKNFITIATDRVMACFEIHIFVATKFILVISVTQKAKAAWKDAHASANSYVGQPREITCPIVQFCPAATLIGAAPRLGAFVKHQPFRHEMRPTTTWWHFSETHLLVVLSLNMAGVFHRVLVAIIQYLNVLRVWP